MGCKISSTSSLAQTPSDGIRTSEKVQAAAGNIRISPEEEATAGTKSGSSPKESG